MIAARKLGAASLCAAVLAVAAGAPPAQAAGEPTVFYASEAREGAAGAPYPPGGGLEGPCGIAVDAKGAFYVSDYYHDAVDAFSSGRKYLTQVSGIDPADGPCGLAVDAAGNLYVNDYHRSVLKFTPAAFPLASGAAYGPGTVIDPNHATGVAVDPATGTVYVNERTHVAAYDSSGAEVKVGGSRLEIGAGLEDGYGLAFSQFPGTAGRLYVGDAATDTVKVYDPALDAIDPVAVIDGAETPTGGFVSLRDTALAVDRVTGELYVVDNLQPVGFERPEAAVYVFKADGSYEGRLSTNVIDARPPGLAVDNSSGGTQGRVYVTSGNTQGASVNIYGPGSASKAAPVCAPAGACPTPAESAGLTLRALSRSADSPAVAGPATPAAKSSGGDGGASIVQKGTLRVEVDGSLSPQKLPRQGAAPIAVTVSGRVSTTDGSHPPQLEALRVELNRHGRLDLAGLPVCPYHRIQPASSSRALSACRGALVGRGRFEAEISLGTQEPYPTTGQMLVFNGRRHGKPVLFGQIYAPRPFATSFVIVFALHRIPHGTYGTALTASLPKALGSWGNLTGLEMRLSRRFTYRGERRSFLSAGCPAPGGFPGTVFSLARTSFRFAGAGELTSTLPRSCQVR
jgi:hypothetical protein